MTDDMLLPVGLLEARHLGRGPGVDLPDKLPRLVLLGVQVEPVTIKIVHLGDVTESRLGRITGHGAGAESN